METKRFKKNDSGFYCENCKKKVEPLGYTSRDHCPYCLYSLHVDIMPGDRANPCRGMLEPISCLPDPKKGFIIIYKCKKCGAIVRNKAALGSNTADDMEKLIALTANQI